MNKTVTKIKNTLEGINSKINEPGEWISDLEDRVVDISPWDRIKKNEWKEMTTVSETSGAALKAPTFELQKYKKIKGLRNIWRDRSWKFPWHGKGKSHPSLRSAEIPIQDKLKKENVEILVNQTNKNKCKGKILKAAMEGQQIYTRESP